MAIASSLVIPNDCTKVAPVLSKEYAKYRCKRCGVAVVSVVAIPQIQIGMTATVFFLIALHFTQ
jgi:hypothetical protein